MHDKQKIITGDFSSDFRKIKISGTVTSANSADKTVLVFKRSTAVLLGSAMVDRDTGYWEIFAETTPDEDLMVLCRDEGGDFNADIYDRVSLCTVESEHDVLYDTLIYDDSEYLINESIGTTVQHSIAKYPYTVIEHNLKGNVDKAIIDEQSYKIHFVDEDGKKIDVDEASKRSDLNSSFMLDNSYDDGISIAGSSGELYIPNGRFNSIPDIFGDSSCVGLFEFKEKYVWDWKDSTGNLVLDHVYQPLSSKGVNGQCYDASKSRNPMSYIKPFEINSDGDYNLSFFFYYTGAYYTSSSYHGTVLGATYAFLMKVNYVGAIYLYTGTGTGWSSTVSANGLLNAYNWYHISINIKSGGSTDIYINGVLSHSRSTPITAPVGNGKNLYLADSRTDNYGLFQKIDQLRLFNRTLDIDEISQLSNEISAEDKQIDSISAHILNNDSLSSIGVGEESVIANYKFNNCFSDVTDNYNPSKFDLLCKSDSVEFNGLNMIHSLGSSTDESEGSVGDESTIDMYCIFSPINISKGTVQTIYKSGGSTDGIGIAIESDGSLQLVGMEGGVKSSISIPSGSMIDGQKYLVVCRHEKVTLYDEEFNIISEIEGSVSAGNGSTQQSVGGSCVSSPVTGLSGKSEFFSGEVYEIGVFDGDMSTVFESHGRLACEVGETGEQCYVEIDNWDVENNQIDMWVNIPEISSTEDTTLRFYFDSNNEKNVEYVGNVNSVPGQKVWDKDYVAVYHMNNDDNILRDSTKNRFHISLTGGLVDESGLISKSILFNGVSDFGSASDEVIEMTQNGFTYEASVKKESQSSSIGSILSAGQTGVDFGPLLSIGQDSGEIRFGTASDYISGGDIIGDSFVNIAASFDGTSIDSSGLSIYASGEEVSPTETGTFSSFGMSSEQFTIGADSDDGMYGGFIEASIDEVRISKIERSSDWISMTNKSNNDMLITHAPVETGELVPNKLNMVLDSSDISNGLSDFPLTVVLDGNISLHRDIFNKLEPDTVDDDFTGEDGDVPNEMLWYLAAGAQRKGYIKDNKLRFYIDVSSDDTQIVDSVFYLTGDFDVQVDYSMHTYTSTSDNKTQFYLESDSGDLAHISNSYQGSRYYTCNTYIDGLWGSEIIELTSDVSGKFRHVRSGTTLTTYYWTGSDWTQIESRAFVSDDLRVQFRARTTTAQSYTTNFDDFKVNSGNIAWGDEYKMSRKIYFQHVLTGQLCAAEIERWDQSNKYAIIHVKIPSYYGSESTEVTLSYDPLSSDNPLIGFIGEDAAKQVWDDNFAAVYHFNSAPNGNGSLTDSTSNGNDGSPYYMDSSNFVENGGLGSAWRFDGTADFVTINGICSELNSNNSNITFEGYQLKSERPAWDSDVLFSLHGSSGNSNRMLLWNRHDQSNYEFSLYNLSSTNIAYVSGPDILSEDYKLISFTYNSVTNDMKTFTDGDITHTLQLSEDWIIEANGRASLGQEYDTTTNSDFFEGDLSEIRISKIARSEDWIKLTNSSLKNTLISWKRIIDESSFESDEKMVKIDFDIDENKLLENTIVPIHINAKQISEEYITEVENPESASDDFTGINGQAPNELLWTVNDSASGVSAVIENNSCKFDVPLSSSDQVTGLVSDFLLSGNFDIQVDFNVTYIDPPSSSSSYVFYMAVSGAGLSSYISNEQQSSSKYYLAFGTNNLSLSRITHHGDTGTFRITRVGNVIRYFYLLDGQWEWNGDTDGLVAAESHLGDVKVSLITSADFNGATTAYVDNFKVNSGEVVWKKRIEDDFIGDNGDLPNWKKWSVNGWPYEDSASADLKIIDNKVAVTATGDDDRGCITTNYKLSGKFDVQFDFEGNLNTQQFYANLYMWEDTDNRSYVLAENTTGGRARFGSIVSGTGTTYEEAFANTYGSLRLIRSGSTLQAMYKDGDSDWKTFSSTNSCVSSDVNIVILCLHGTATSGVTYIDNFKASAEDIIHNKFVEETFTGIDGDAPNKDMWIINEDLWDTGYEDSPVFINNNMLQIGDGESYQYGRAQIRSLFKVDGDFDYKIDYDTTNNLTSDYISFYAWIDVDNRAIVAYYPMTGKFSINVNIGAVWTGSIATIASSDSGSMRFKRTGSVIEMYHNIGSGWVKDGEYEFLLDPVNVVIHANNVDNTSDYNSFDNLRIVSENIIWPDGYTNGSGINKFDFLEVFDELAPQNVDDDFTTLNQKYWRFNDSESQDLFSHDEANGRLKFYRNEADSLTHYIKSFYRVSGDYDVQFDFGVNSIGSANNQAAGLQINSGSFSAIIIRYASGTNGYWFFIGGTSGYIASADNIGKLRITRVGTLVTVYSYTSSNWTSRMTGTDSGLEDGSIHIFARQQNSQLLDSWVDNFKINKGGIVWGYPNQLAIKNIETQESCFIELPEAQWDGINKSAIMYARIPSVSSSDSYGLYYDYENNDNTLIDTVLSPEEASDDFTGNDGDAPDADKWLVNRNDHWTAQTFSAANTISNNQLKIESTSTSTSLGNVRSTYTLSGDFSVEVDFDLSNTSDYAVVTMYAWADWDNRMYLQYNNTVDRFRGNSCVSGTWGTNSDAIISLQAGGFRLDRTGDQVSFYRKEDSSWILQGTLTCAETDLFIVLQGDHLNVSDSYTLLDNFQINYADKILKYSPISDDFIGNNGDKPRSDLWRTIGNPTIQSGGLRISHDLTSQNTVVSMVKLSGDFDIQIDYSNYLTNDDAASATIGLRVHIDSINNFYLNKYTVGGSDYYNSAVTENGSVTYGTAIPVTQSSGKMRLIRVGSKASFLYWDGSAWVELSISNDTVFTDDCYIMMLASAWGSDAISLDVDSFQVNYAEGITGYLGDIGSVPGQQVWIDSSIFATHLAQDPTTPVLDSTKNANNGTSSGFTSGDLVDGPAGKMIEFTSTTDYIDFGSDSSLDVVDEGTIEVFFIPTQIFDASHGYYLELFSKGDVYTANERVSVMLRENQNNNEIEIVAGVGDVYVGAAIYSGDMDIRGELTFVSVTFKIGEPIKVYYNGSLMGESSTPLTTITPSTDPLRLGKSNANDLNHSMQCSFISSNYSNRAKTDDEIAAISSSLVDNLITFTDPTTTPGLKNPLPGWEDALNIVSTISSEDVLSNQKNFPVRVSLGQASGIQGTDCTSVIPQYKSDFSFSGTEIKKYNLGFEKNGFDGLTCDNLKFGFNRVNDPNKSMYFDGSGKQIITLSNSIRNELISDKISISFWVKTNAYETTDRAIFGTRYQNEMDIMVDEDYRRIYVAYGNGSSYHALATPTNSHGYGKEWSHITYTRDFSKKRHAIYLDGILVSSSSSLSYVPTANSSYSVRIGDNSSRSAFVGYLSDFIIFNKELTSEDVSDVYRMGVEKYIGNYVVTIFEGENDMFQTTLGEDINSISVSNDTYGEQKVSYAFSSDKETYKQFTNGSWVSIASKNELEHGNSGDSSWYYNISGSWIKSNADRNSTIAKSFLYNVMDDLQVVSLDKNDIDGVYNKENGMLDIAFGMLDSTDSSEKVRLNEIILNNKKYWQSEIYDLSLFGNDISTSKLNWVHKSDASSFKVFVIKTGDSSWTECTENGGQIPGITSGMDTTGINMQFKVEFDLTIDSSPDDIALDIKIIK